jgi:rubrerythrin
MESFLLNKWKRYGSYGNELNRKKKKKKKGEIFSKVADLSFEWAQKVEVTHAEALKLAKIALEAGHALETIFICRVCGNLILTPPKKIYPVCGHDISFYLHISPVEGEK